MEAARAIWQMILATNKDDAIRNNALKHLRALDVDQAVPLLEAVAQAYKRKTGVWPRDFREMVSAGLLLRVPVDPIGNPYQLKPNGRVEVQDYIALPFISKGLPPGEQPSIFDFSASKSDTKQKNSSR